MKILNLLFNLLIVTTILGYVSANKEYRVGGASECGICEYVVTLGETLLQNNHTITEIETTLEKACVLLPDNLQAPCNYLVSNYLPTIIEKLEQEYPPSVVCTDLGICQSYQNVFMVCERSNLTCSACLSFMNKFETTLENLIQSPTWDKIVVELETMCSKLSQTEATICEMLVGTLPDIINMEISNFPPDRVCEMVHAC